MGAKQPVDVKSFFTFMIPIVSTSLLAGWIPCHFKQAAITGLFKKLAPAANVQ